MAALGKSKHTAQHRIPPSLCSSLSEAVCCLSTPPAPPRPYTSAADDNFGFFGFGSPSSLVMATFCCCPPSVVVLSGCPPTPLAVTAAVGGCAEPSPSDMAAANDDVHCAVVPGCFRVDFSDGLFACKELKRINGGIRATTVLHWCNAIESNAVTLGDEIAMDFGQVRLKK